MEEVAGASIIFQIYLEGSGEMRELTEYVMERLLEEFEGVIHASLKKLILYMSNQQY